MSFSAAPPTPFRRLSRWVPVGVLGATNAVAWSLYAAGGMPGVYGWLILLGILPTMGLIAVLLTLVHAIRSRRFSLPMGLTVLAGGPSLFPGLWAFGIALMTFPSDLDAATPTATGRLPADGPLRVLWGGDRVETNRHAATPDQRWAYDFVVEPALVGSHRLEDYGCWGLAVLSPVSGVVRQADDELPDESPGRASNNTAHPLGNTVAIQLASGTYLVVAHLQQGSVIVTEGDRVDEGQPLGRCGNSGNSAEPHVHVHHQRQNPKRYPASFAEGLPLFFRDHDGSSMPEGGIELRDGERALVGDVVQHEASRPATSASGRHRDGG